MIQSIEGFPAELQASLFSNGERLGQADVKVIDSASLECVAPYGRGIRLSNTLDPVNLRRRNAGAGVRVAVLGVAISVQDCTAVERRSGIADVRPVYIPNEVVIPIGTVVNGEGSTRLKRGDACEGPSTKSKLPGAIRRARNLPEVGK